MSTKKLDIALVRDFLEQGLTFEDALASSRRHEVKVKGARELASIATAVLYMAGERRFYRSGADENRFSWRLFMFYTPPQIMHTEGYNKKYFKQRAEADKLCCASRDLGLHEIIGNHIKLTTQAGFEALMAEPALVERARVLYRETLDRWRPHVNIDHLEGPEVPESPEPPPHPPVTLDDIRNSMARVIELVDLYEAQQRGGLEE